MTPPPAAAPQSAPKGPDIFQLALQNKWLLIAGLVVGLGFGQLAYLQLGVSYEAVAQVLVSKKASTALKDERDQTVGERGEHVQLIMSPLIVGEAVRKSRLDQLPSLKGSPDPIEDILDELTVRRISGTDKSHTNMLEIVYRSKVKNDATQVVAAVIKAYREYLSRSQQEHIAEMLTLINRASVDLKDNLRQKQRSYAEFRKRSPLIWKNGPGQDGQPNDMTNIHQERVIALDAERRELQIRRTSLATKLKELEDAQARGESRATLELLAERFAADDRGQSRVTPLSDTFSVLRTMEQHLLPLFQEEERLLRNFGSNHPDVLDVRRKIAATREFYTRLGVDLPQGDAPPGAPVDPGLNPKVDLVATFIGSLKREIAELDQRDASLTKQFEDEMIKAKDLAIVQIEDQERSSEIKNDTKLLDAIVNQINVLNIGKDNAGFSLRIIAEPQEGLDFKRQLKIVGGAAAVVLAFLMGGLYLRALLDTRLKTPEEVQQSLGLSVMGRVPTIDFGTAQRHLHSLIDPAVYYFHNPDTPAAEAYRSVRTALFVMLPARGWKVLQVTSSEPQDGKTTLSTCLAVSMAQAGKKVLLIDADMRCPKVHVQFGLKGQLGLSDVLAGEIDPANALHNTEVPGLTVLPSGISPPNPSEMLSSPRLEMLLKAARQEFDYVIVDTPPVLAVTDPAQIAPRVDGVLLVVRLQKNRTATVKRAREILEQQGITPVGVVVTGVDRQATYGAYNYRSAAPSASKKPAAQPANV